MKKSIIALFLALGFVAGTDAFASRARLVVTGTGDAGAILDGAGGSFYVEDAYNMFYNPSYVNEYKDWGIIERSVAGGSATGNHPFGGFVTSMMNTNVGVFFNRTSAMGPEASAVNTHPIELIVGGDHGVKWGAGLSYGHNGNATGTDTDVMLRLGAQFDGLDPFLSYRLIDKEKSIAAGNTYKDMTIGTRYHWGEWTPYTAFRQKKTNGNTMTNNFGLGMGRNAKVAEGVKLHYGFGFWRNVNKAAGTSTSVVPVDMSVEGDATSWLALRAGLNYRLWDQTGKATNADAATGRLGATFKWNKLSMDWAVGSGTAAAATAETIDNSTFGFDGQFFAATSLQYTW